MGFHAELNGLDLHSPSRETIVGGTGDLSALTCVKIIGIGDYFPKVETANGDTDKVAGVIVTAVTEGVTGSMWTLGRLANINTSQWSKGTLLYCDTSGQLNVSPTTTILKAVCLEQHSASGALYLYNTISMDEPDVSSLADVGALTASAGDVLVWDGATWSATGLSGVGAHIGLSSLANVGALTPSAGDVLIYDCEANVWSATAASGLGAYIGISSLANVGALTPSAGDILIWDGANWSATAVCAIGSYFNLSSVSDVVGGASADDSLVWKASNSTWAPGPGGGGGGGSIIFWNDTCGASPLEEYVNGMKTSIFDAGGSQTLYGHVILPDSHKAGDQVNLITSLVATATGEVKLIAEVDMIRMGTDAMSSTANHYSSTNGLIAVTAINTPYKVVIPLTNELGVINSLEISGSDGVILTIGIRAITDSASSDIRLLSDIMEVSI